MATVDVVSCSICNAQSLKERERERERTTLDSEMMVLSAGSWYHQKFHGC